VLDWIDDTTFGLGHVKFRLDYAQGGTPLKSEPFNFVMMKTPSFLREYVALQGQGIKKVLELGVYQGGSLVFLDRLLNPEKISAVELSIAPIPALDSYAAAHSDRMKVYYGTSQDDDAALNRIIDNDFGGQVDLVVDDASHWYEQTKAAFLTAFPKLKPGGFYIIEDWNWSFHEAYQDEAHEWHPKASLANILIDLAEELTINNSVESMRVEHDMIVIKKTEGANPGRLFQGRGLRGRERVLI